jgi:hypothetical protein
MLVLLACSGDGGDDNTASPPAATRQRSRAHPKNRYYDNENWVGATLLAHALAA